MTMTPEEIRNHVGEVWENNNGRKSIPLFIGEFRVFYRCLSGLNINGEFLATFDDFLVCGNLPQSLRKPSPRMVKAPGWRVWYGDDNPCEGSIGALTEDEARKSAEKYIKYVANIAIQAPGSDEMEVVKGFE